MSSSGITSDELRQQHAADVTRTVTFKTHGVSAEAATDYLDTPEGKLFWQRLVDADLNAPLSEIRDRAIKQLRSGLQLPRVETIGPGEALVKFVPKGSAPSPHSPYWARESEANAAAAAGKNISDYFGLPIGSEAPQYDAFRMSPKAPTQIFVNTVAPTSELNGLVTKSGGAEQVLVPNRHLFNEPVRLKNVDNLPNLAITVERGITPTLARGAGVLGAAAVAYDATTTAAHASGLLHDGNQVGAASQVEHFAGRNLGALGGAVAGAEALGAAGIESGPGDLIFMGIGAIGGAVAGDKLVDAYGRHKIYSQTDPQGHTWQLDPDHPQQGWTRHVVDAFVERALSHTHVETADPALANRLTYQANTTAAELAMAHTGKPVDPWTQPSNAQDTHSFGNPPWQRNASTGQWQREIAYPFVERQPARPARLETAPPRRSAELNAAAEHTMADNLATSPRGIAERYQALYAERGWQRYGPMPEAITRALTTAANRLEASDGHTYTRGKDGEWTTPGRFWGHNVASGNLRAELAVTEMLREAGAKASAPPAMEPTAHRHTLAMPAAPAATRETSKLDAQPERTRTHDAATATLPPARNDLRHPGHPQHALYAAFKQLLPEGTSEARLAQATAASHAAGMRKPEDVANIYSGANGKVLITTNSLFAGMAEMDISQPPPTVLQSLQAIEQHDQQQQQMRLQAQHEIAQPASRSAAMHR